jgi:hypothetical protein
MKTNTYTIIFSILLFLVPSIVLGQDQISVPLSNPGQPGNLNLSIMLGTITVTGTDANEVVIRYKGNGAVSMRGQDAQTREAPEGMRRVSRPASGFEVTENNNSVSISGVMPINHIDFEIMVPRNFSLTLAAVNGRAIRVVNVNGDHEISHVNGDVELQGVSGSALVNTVNGSITADFNRVGSDKPLSFNNINGRIDVSIPAATRFTTRMRSEMGEIFTDFDFDERSQEGPRVQSGTGRHRVEVNNWVVADVNGGGPEYQFRTLRGDIYLRRK